MRAAVLREYGEPLVVEEVPDPEPDPDAVVVETEACGVCRSDWHGWQGHGEWIDGKPPIGQVLGHEPAGTVVAVGEDVETLAVGDQVAVPFNLGDGTCHQCRNGRGNVCDDLLPLGFVPEAPGAFAEQVHVPAADFNVVELPEGVSPVDMASLGCRFMTAFHALAHRADVSAGDWVAVHGCGGVGLSAVQIAAALGATVVAVDIDDEKLELARELGASAVVDASETDDVPAAIREVTDGGAHVSVDALGVAETAHNSVDCLRTRGTHVQVGLTTDEEAGEVPLPTDDIVVKELAVVGSHGMPPTRYDELFRMISSGALDPGKLATETIALEAVSDRLAAMSDYETVGIPVVTEF